jgi:hypothetical protein
VKKGPKLVNNESDDAIIGEFTRGQGAIAALLAGLVFVALLVLGYDSVAQAALISSVAIISAVWIFRPLWRRTWFWVTMTCIAVAHVAAIMVVPWPFEDGVRLAPLMVLDIIVVLGLVSLLAKLMRGGSKTAVR